jgi:hypothetical protein
MEGKLKNQAVIDLLITRDRSISLIGRQGQPRILDFSSPDPNPHDDKNPSFLHHKAR